uniref:Zn(2)-C6 fungal-type domain-containing protein n=1 Tax=Amorphochlora amoebiformis TaxID=1561963 RepID=A0A7S0H561_9EUKA|mmetsp:Transcript_4577/g.6965  ORF Transcript_4577/g.6965 Transcript_4577/m.6965 type:complete len:445 (+) Transcript_4577:114-1448(+)
MQQHVPPNPEAKIAPTTSLPQQVEQVPPPVIQIRGTGDKSYRQTVDNPSMGDRSTNPAKLQRKKERERLRRSVLKEKIETLRRLIQPFLPNGQAMERAFILSEAAKLLARLIRENTELRLLLNKPASQGSVNGTGAAPSVATNQAAAAAAAAAAAHAAGIAAAPAPPGVGVLAGVPPTIMPTAPVDSSKWFLAMARNHQEEQKVMERLQTDVTRLSSELSEKNEMIKRLQEANPAAAAVAVAAAARKRNIPKRSAPTKKACTNCVQAKRRCDVQRPCTACTKRGDEDTCKDAPPRIDTKKRKRPMSSVLPHELQGPPDQSLGKPNSTPLVPPPVNPSVIPAVTHLTPATHAMMQQTMASVIPASSGGELKTVVQTPSVRPVASAPAASGQGEVKPRAPVATVPHSAGEQKPQTQEPASKRTKTGKPGDMTDPLQRLLHASENVA